MRLDAPEAHGASGPEAATWRSWRRSGGGWEASKGEEEEGEAEASG